MTCTHYFRIDPPSGPTSEGACKLCGETRTFKNWDDPKMIVTSSDWGQYKMPKELAHWGRRRLEGVET